MTSLAEWASKNLPASRHRPAKTTRPPPKQPEPEGPPIPSCDPETCLGIGPLDRVNAHELADRLRAWYAEQLGKDQTMPVVGDGDAQARVVIVGKAPAEHECRTGRPFAGRSGEQLRTLLKRLEMRLSATGGAYATNASFWFAPAGQEPFPRHLDASRAGLRKILSLIAPEVIIACGRAATNVIVGDRRPIEKLRGRWHTIDEEMGGWQSDDRPTAVRVTYHPAYALREPGLRMRNIEQDFDAVRDHLESQVADIPHRETGAGPGPRPRAGGAFW